MNGLIDWNHIEDRIRKPYLEYAVDSVSEAIDDTIRYYKLHRQKKQRIHIEIWTEKDAVSNILKRVSEYFHIRLMINRGYSSCSAMYDTAKRMLQAADKYGCTILYVGDHDPSGLDMLRDIRERLEEFEVCDFEVIPVALTMKQIKQYDPPPNPAKQSDPRAGWYIEKYGTASWELDALRPDVLEQIVKDAVLKYLDVDLFNKMLDKEASDKKKLQKIIDEVKE